jgi:hypothetical protein
MIIEDIRNIRSEKRDLRNFGITMCVGLGVLGVLFFWRDKGAYVYFLVLSPVFLILGLTVPVALKPAHKVWMSLAVVLSWFMTRVILSLLFYLGITPISFLGRLFGRRFLDVAMEDSKESYWIYREKQEKSQVTYEKQY